MASKRSSVLERRQRVLDQAQAVLQGNVGVDWRADWPYEWAQTLTELAEIAAQPDFWRPTGVCPEC